MMAAIFPSLAAANAFAATVDAAQGYPKPGSDIGAGVHAPPAQTVTVTYAIPVAHPTLPQWAYPADPVTTPKMSAPQLATVVTLDATWATAQQVIS